MPRGILAEYQGFPHRCVAKMRDLHAFLRVPLTLADGLAPPSSAAVSRRIEDNPPYLCAQRLAAGIWTIRRATLVCSVGTCASRPLHSHGSWENRFVR